MKRLLDSGLLRSIAAGLAGFIVYGSWAYYINLPHGFEIGMRAGLVQGSYSLALTLSTGLSAETVFGRSRRLSIEAHRRYP